MLLTPSPMALFGLLFVYFAKESIDTKCGFVRLFLKKVDDYGWKILEFLRKKTAEN